MVVETVAAPVAEAAMLCALFNVLLAYCTEQLKFAAIKRASQMVELFLLIVGFKLSLMLQDRIRRVRSRALVSEVNHRNQQASEGNYVEA